MNLTLSPATVTVTSRTTTRPWLTFSAMKTVEDDEVAFDPTAQGEVLGADEGDSAEYTIKLDAQPSSDVMVAISVTEEGQRCHAG